MYARGTRKLMCPYLAVSAPVRDGLPVCALRELAGPLLPARSSALGSGLWAFLLACSMGLAGLRCCVGAACGCCTAGLAGERDGLLLRLPCFGAGGRLRLAAGIVMTSGFWRLAAVGLLGVSADCHQPGCVPGSRLSRSWYPAAWPPQQWALWRLMLCWPAAGQLTTQVMQPGPWLSCLAAPEELPL